MYTGLSLSFCVADIAKGRVRLEEVDKIIAGTMFKTQEEMDSVLGDYREVYWEFDPDKCEQIARQLIAEDRIEQPRLHGDDSVNIADGHWLLNGQKVRL